MSRGKKLDLQIGADFGESEWNVVKEKHQSTIAKIIPPQKHLLIFKKEKRRAKTVTLVGPFSLEKEVLKALLKSLKKSLGCGGTINETFLEFQGDIQTKLQEQLEKREYRFKKRA